MTKNLAEFSNQTSLQVAHFNSEYPIAKIILPKLNNLLQTLKRTSVKTD